MAKKKAKKPAAKKSPARKKAAPKRKPAAKKPGDKTGAALHSLLGDLRGGPMKSEEE